MIKNKFNYYVIKIFSLIFLFIANPCFGQAKAMEKSKSKTVPKLQRLVILTINNKNINLPEDFPDILKTHCKWKKLKPSIKEHLNSFKQFQCESFKITEDNLNNYNKLLRKLFYNNFDIKPILSAIDNHFISTIKTVGNSSSSDIITLEDINKLLTLLSRHNLDTGISEQQVSISEQEIDLLKSTIFMAAFAPENIHKAILELILEIINKEDYLDKLINAQNSKGLTPLILAASRANHKIIRSLINNGADKQLKCNNGFTALTYAKFGKTKFITDLEQQWTQEALIIENKNSFDLKKEKHFDKCIKLLEK